MTVSFKETNEYQLTIGEIQFFAEKLIKKLQHPHDERDNDNLFYNDNDIMMYDAYNYKHKRLELLFLDNYGDDNPLVLMTSEEFEILNKKSPINPNHVRLDVYTSFMIVDKYLNCYLLDIKNNCTFNIIEIINNRNIEIKDISLSSLIGGKRAYYYNIKTNSASLRFNSEYENYLAKLGIRKEEGRENMLTSYRFSIYSQ